MIDPFAFVVIALAGWRLAYMLTNEDGPGDIFGAWRRSLATEDMLIKPGSLEKLSTCVYCMSFWTTANLAIVWFGIGYKSDVLTDAVQYGITFLAMWGAATALDMVARKD